MGGRCPHGPGQSVVREAFLEEGDFELGSGGCAMSRRFNIINGTTHHTYFTSFSATGLLLFQDPLCDTTLHFITMTSYSLSVGFLILPLSSERPRS